MRRVMSGLGLSMAALFAALPAASEAQLVVNVGLRWESADAGWRDERVEERTFFRGVRVPPGHLPRPGFCKLWFPGRPPGHQPRASKCEHMIVRHRTASLGFGPSFADALLLVGPDRQIPIDSRDVRFVDDHDRFSEDGRRGHGSRKHRGRG